MTMFPKLHAFAASHTTHDALVAIMAFANSALPDSDPRKITWAMVIGIRTLASRVDMSDGECHVCGYRDDMPTTHNDPVHQCPIFAADTWADALAAFLPPETDDDATG